MASVDFYIGQNDTRPVLERVLEDADGEPVDVTGATVRFSMRQGSTVVVNRAAASIVGSGSDGTVRYTWSSGDTSRSGDHEAEFEVTYADNSVQTFPNPGKIKVRITDDVA